MRNLIPFFCSCVLISCCESGGKRIGNHAQNCTDVVVQHQDITPVGSFIEEIRILPLQSNGEHLIGGVDNLLFTKDRIIVADMHLSKSVYIFDSEGKSRAVISRLGRGPGEYLAPFYTTLTPDEKIAIYDNRGSKVLFFDLDGNFLETKNVGFLFREFEYIDQDNIVCITYGVAKDPGLEKADADGNLVIFTDGDFNIKASTLPNIYGENAGFPIAPELEKMQDEVFLTPAFNDTIYKVNPGSLDPYYHLDLSAIGGVTHLDAGTTGEEYTNIMDHTILFSGEFSENDSFLMFRLAENREVKVKIFDRRTKKLFSLGRGIVNNPARVGWFDESILSSRYIFNNQFVALVPAYHILMGYPSFAETYPQLTGLTDNSNPVLVFTKLKSPDKSNN